MTCENCPKPARFGRRYGHAFCEDCFQAWVEGWLDRFVEQGHFAITYDEKGQRLYSLAERPDDEGLS